MSILHYSAADLDI